MAFTSLVPKTTLFFLTSPLLIKDFQYSLEKITNLQITNVNTVLQYGACWIPLLKEKLGYLDHVLI